MANLSHPVPRNPGLVRRTLTAWLLAGRVPGGSAWLLARLHARMRRDGEWAAYYHALRALERAAREEADPALSLGQRDLLEGLVLSAVADEPANSTRMMARIGVGLLAPAALALAFVVVGRTSPDEPAWSARGVANGTANAAPRIGLRARCVDRANQALRSDVAVGPGQTTGALTCGGADLLAFSLTNLAAEARYVFVVGVSRDGALRWYAPFEEAMASQRVSPGEVDRLVDVVADLSSMPADDVSLFVLFSDRPITGADVRQQLSRALTEHMPLAAQERLPIDAPWQARIDLRREAPR